MSLKIAKAFVAAIRRNDHLTSALGADADGKGARIFPVARLDEDEKEDIVPYLIVMPNGVQTEGSKDDYEQVERATIGIMICDETFEGLVDLADEVRSTLADNLQECTDQPYSDYTFSAGPVQCDSSRPCYYQTLSYTITI